MVRPMTNWRAEDAHRRGHRLAHHRLARARGEAAQHRAPIMLAGLARRSRPGQHQRPGRGVDEAATANGRDAAPNRPAASLSRISRSMVAGIGNAQQRLGEAHERDALLRRQRDIRSRNASMPPPPWRRLRASATRRRADAAMRLLSVGASAAAARMRATGLGLVQAIGRAHRVAQRIGRRRGIAMDPVACHALVAMMPPP